MTFESSRMRQLDDPLSALLVALKGHGMAVGVDDARRIATVFTHAEDWSQQRRVRALKALIARSDAERQLIEQLTPMLFVRAETETKRAEKRLAEKAGDVLQPVVKTAATLRNPAPRNATTAPQSLISRWLQKRWPILVTVAIVLSGLWLLNVLWNQPVELDAPQVVEEEAPDETPQEEVEPPPATTLPNQALGPAELPFEPEFEELVRLKQWPWLLALVILITVLFYLGRRAFLAAMQTRSINQLAKSRGPRHFKLDLPPGQLVDIEDPQRLRELTFAWSAPTVPAESNELDVIATISATARAAGLPKLHYRSVLEHRPILFIEDVGPSMARWPDLGTQMADALNRQGTTIVHRFMDRAPHRIAETPEMRRAETLEQVLSHHDEAMVILLTDAAGLDDPAKRAGANWLSILESALWLHPSSESCWGSGARWLASHIRLTSLLKTDVLRAQNQVRTDQDVAIAWHPPRTRTNEPAARMKALKATLKEDAYRWLAAGAVLARADALTTRLWWVMRQENVAKAADRAAIEPVLTLPDIEITPSGTVAMDRGLADELVQDLERHQPDLLGKVVGWATRLITAAVEREDGATAAMATLKAKLLRARLWLSDQQQRTRAHDALRALAGQGLGAWAKANLGKTEQQHVRSISFARLPPVTNLQKLVLGTIAICVLLAFGGAMKREWRVALLMTKPSFELVSTQDRVVDGVFLMSAPRSNRSELTLAQALPAEPGFFCSFLGWTVAWSNLCVDVSGKIIDSGNLQDGQDFWGPIRISDQNNLYIYDRYKLYQQLWVSAEDVEPIEAAIIEHPLGQVWWIRSDLLIFADAIASLPESSMRRVLGDISLDLSFGYHKASLDHRINVLLAVDPEPPIDPTTDPDNRKRLEPFRDCSDCPEVVPLPGGTFLMGSLADDELSDQDEGSQRMVTVSPFAMGKTEVTFDQWDACVDAGGCDNKPEDEGWGRGNRPVINVSWEESQQYTAWLSERTGHIYRLPNEAEWEYAARAGTKTKYYWESELDEDPIHCQFANGFDLDGMDGGAANDLVRSPIDCRDGFSVTAPAGSYTPNDFGLYDMSGNVWEWTTGARDSNDEAGSTIARGGSWDIEFDSLGSTSRISMGSGGRLKYFGFRVARTLAQPQN